ncbi:substrate-binding domain-containing protein [Mesorhizobium sp. VK24D]|uniref:Substrate-binding domain-containing protein n=1 Tax=Mesorhizobium album TaxID=3072314 RepID=A0ABU4Y725_9HYPH|nr:substrate-binding domain-containing protein [Mesorhizobium sp. VK24D]MDX8482541.1 substrate-binding domain-containing protein [Mesorhizobium sp. VK24D]
MKKFMTAGLGALAIATALSGTFASAKELKGSVYLLVPNVSTLRWAKFDIPNITAALQKEAPGVKLEVLNANDNMQQQLSQAESALANGALGIILVAVDPPRSAGILAKADADGVPVVTYAHDPGAGPVAYHVVVPYSDIGEAQGKLLAENLPEHRPVRLAYMLGDPNFSFYSEQMKGWDKNINPLVANGSVEIVCRADAMFYLPANAQKNMEQCLTKADNKVDAAVIMNDDTGGGVVAALANQNLTGKVKLFGGYDATLEGIQRVLAGWQAADMAPGYKAMANAAVKLLLSKIEGQEPPADLVTTRFDNHFVKGGVPTFAGPNVFITADNVQTTVVDEGLFTKAEICTGIAVGSAFCKK